MNLGDWAGMAATSFVAGLLQAANGFGFAVLERRGELLPSRLRRGTKN